MRGAVWHWGESGRSKQGSSAMESDGWTAASLCLSVAPCLQEASGAEDVRQTNEDDLLWPLCGW